MKEMHGGGGEEENEERWGDVEMRREGDGRGTDGRRKTETLKEKL